jgi:hypothetical protein
MLDDQTLNQLLLQVAAKHGPYHGLSMAVVVSVGAVVPKLSYHIAAHHPQKGVVAQGPPGDNLEQALNNFKKAI